MSFCTVVNCLDGRVQRPVTHYLSKFFAAEYVDVVTDAGPVGVLASNPGSERSESIYRRIDVSIDAHSSKGLGIVAHHDCAGNPKPMREQMEDLRVSASLLQSRYANLVVVALWVDENGSVTDVAQEKSNPP